MCNKLEIPSKRRKNVIDLVAFFGGSAKNNLHANNSTLFLNTTKQTRLESDTPTRTLTRAENVDSSEIQVERESFQSLTQNMEHWSD